MKRFTVLMMLAGCSSGEGAPFIAMGSGGAAVVEPSAGRSSVGGSDSPSAGASPAGAAGETSGGSGGVAGSSSASGGGQGGESETAGMNSGGASGSDVGGSGGSSSSGGLAGASGSGGQAGSPMAGSGGASGAGCLAAEDYVWKVTGATCRCNGQCNRTAVQCTGMEGKSCLNEMTCQADCYKPTPDSCGAADTWHVQGSACVCGSCSKSTTGCKLGNQCLISTDGLTCKEAC
jgi:hypothetical protein